MSHNTSKVILISTSGLYPYCKNAPARLLKSIGEELADLGVSITFVCISPNGSNELQRNINWQEVFKNPQITTWHREKKKTFFARRLQEISACIYSLKKSNRGSLFLFNSPPYGLLSLFAVSGKLLGRKTAYIAHGGVFVENVSSFPNKIRRLNLTKISFALDGVITVSQAFAEHLKQFFPDVPIHTIHNSLECTQGSRYPLTSKSDDKPNFNIFYMGRLEKVKGLETLLYSFQLLYKVHKNCRLIIAGDGSYGHALQQLAQKLKIKNAVSFVGFINKKEKERYFNEADIFVVPSTYFETFGMVILEAMCFQVPVIASRIGGIPEIIINGETGILFDPGDKRDLFKKIDELYIDKQKREALAKAAYKRIKRDFCTQKMGVKYFNFISDLTNKTM